MTHPTSTLWAAGAAILFVPAIALTACAQGKTFTDPADAGPDYAVQGEYVGSVGEKDAKKIGVQVIAKGRGAFHVVVHIGGLPGEGWTREDEKHEADTKTIDGVVTATNGDHRLTVHDGVVTLYHEGQEVGKLKKVTRKSSTLGAKPPEGAVVLFDGKSADAFVDGKMTKEGFLMAGTSTKKRFGDAKIHLEFRTPFKPAATGQARGNSGIYLQSCYEIQILDSFGLSGENNECGGFYQIRKPDVNMCYPPLLWQTYDFDFTAAKYTGDKKTASARVTVRQNGVMIHKDIELPHATPGRLGEGPQPQPLYFQGHGNPVVFRNVWVVPK